MPGSIRHDGGCMRKFVHDFLKWVPVAVGGGAVAVAGVWDKAKDWIAAQAVWAWSEMSDPWIATFVVVAVLFYIAAIIWTGREEVSTAAPEPAASHLGIAEIIWDAKQESVRSHTGDDSQRKRDLIDGLRRDVVRNARNGDKRKHIRTYLNGHTDFHAAKKYLSAQFLEELDGSALTFWALQEPSDLNELEELFLGELDRLETEWGLAPKPIPEAPNIPLTVNSLGAYVRGFPRVRKLTRQIAESMERIVDDDPEGHASESDVEMAQALGITTILQLDEAIRREEVLILRIGPYFATKTMFRDYSVMCLFYVLGGRMGGAAYYDTVKGLQLTSTGVGFCKDLERIYGLITAY